MAIIENGIFDLHTEKRSYGFFLCWCGLSKDGWGGIWFISCVGGESIEAPRDQHKPRTLVSIMNVIYQRLWIIGINFLNYLVCHWQTRHIEKKTGKPNKEYGLKHLLPVKALQKAVWYLRSRRLLSWKRNAVNTKFQDISIIIIILLFDGEGLQVWLSPIPFVSLLYTSLFFLQSCGLSPPPPIWLTFTSIYIDNWSVDWLIYYIALTFFHLKKVRR